MTELDLKFKSLRVKLRKSGMDISEDVFKRYHPTTKNAKDEICVFCYSTSKITKEHILPKWMFEKNTEISFISSVNRQTQTYNKAVIPTCSVCNNSILSHIENHIIKVIEGLEAYEIYNNDDLCNIIRWLEILDYKLQVYDCRRKYIKYGNSEYDHDWGTMPVAWLRHLIDLNPFKVLEYLRSSQRRITVKAKTTRISSLVIFDTSKPQFIFFSQPNEYIFVSFPMYKIALFYFLRKKHEHYMEAYNEALYLMHKVFES